MITKQKQLFYFVDGKPYASLAEAQSQDLNLLMESTGWTPQAKGEICLWMLENSVAIVDTLTTTPKSRLRARKAHGAIRKKQQPAQKAAPKQAPVPAPAAA